MMEGLKTTALACLLLASPPSPAPLAAQDDRGRERWQRVPDVFAALGVRSGARIADIGAGGGFFTARLAEAVGAEGRVFAVDVDGAVIGRLGSWLAVQDLLIAGYRITRLEDPFIEASESGGGGESGWWLLVAERPSAR